jgi:3-oxoacyl-[acyl-carrier protein] reductase
MKKHLKELVMNKPWVLITGASRKIGIAAACARALARDGWNIVLSYWQKYDETMSWGSESQDVLELKKELEVLGSKVVLQPADLEETSSAGEIFNALPDISLQAMVLSHCFSVDSDILSTSIEAFDRHFHINVRASWLLIREFVKQFSAEPGSGRIIAMTSDHVAWNMPYGASKGAMDRIVIAAAQEFQSKGICCNVINPGATDTGWMDEELKKEILSSNFSSRIGLPEDAANMVRFLCSKEGAWINGQILYSDGGRA